MEEKHKLSEIADAVRSILSQYGLMDTYELWDRLKDVGILYTYRTLLKKLQQIEQENTWLHTYFSNGYVWYLDNPCGLENNQDIFAAILTDEYQELWTKWLGVDANSEDRVIYSAQIDSLERILNRLTNVGLKIEGWDKDEDWSDE